MSIREQFESWYLDNWGHTEDHHETLFERSPDDESEYYRLGVRLAHQAWQAATNAMEAKCAALAAENARYSMSAGQADQRMSESRAVRAALGFNPDADDVSPSDLVEKIYRTTAELCVIRTAHPQPIGPIMDAAIDAFNAEEMPETGMLNAFFILRDSIRVETPATDSFLADVRAQGVEMYADSNYCSEDNQAGAFEFAAQLRKGASA